MTSEDEETAKQNISYGRFKTVYEALAPILSESQTTREQGAKYEALCAYFLKADPYWSKYYSRVARWSRRAAWPDSPVFGQNQDIGFDLIAQTAASGEWHAIQCKCYDPTSRCQGSVRFVFRRTHEPQGHCRLAHYDECGRAGEESRAADVG